LVVFCTAACFSLVAGGSGASAQMFFQPFSADQIHTVGRKTLTSKVYASSSAFRVETEQSGKKSISIMRLDKKVMWILMPEQKMYMEMANLGASTAEMAQNMQGAKIERQALGTEQVGTFHCDKSRVKVTYEGREYTTLEWAAKELNGFVVKRQDEKGSWSTEFQNIKLGPQDPSLFEVPGGYRKFSLGGMMAPR
jgi:hypothetical protein